MIRIGSRGSQLARWQAEHIAARLHLLGLETRIEIIVTTGDKTQNAPFLQVGTKGMFTKEIEESLLENRIDLAVHSMKDLPTALATAFCIAAIPRRADARDAFVSVHHDSLEDLPKNAVIGTSSLRRQAQLRALRPDLLVKELRGNVDTRLRKLMDGSYGAILLASAGLERLGFTQYLRGKFAADTMCPAAAQGALAIECRSDDDKTKAAVSALHHVHTGFAVTVERTVLGSLGGGCHLPVGVYCEPENDSNWKVTAAVVSPDGTSVLKEKIVAAVGELTEKSALALGSVVAQRLLEQGAREMLAALSVASSENLTEA